MAERLPLAGAAPTMSGCGAAARDDEQALSGASALTEVELWALELRFAPLRLAAPRRVAALARSIERSGQLSAVVAVREANGALVLVDGYLRIAALRRLGADTATVQLWRCSLGEALAQVLAATQARGWDVIEEALVLRELTSVLGLSQHRAAQRCGRDVSWVSRRLKLLDTLPDTALEAICQGVLSSWAASRILAPLARANAAHAQALVAALRRTPLSTRELGVWHRHYTRASRATRERLVEEPALFIQSVNARAQAHTDQRLRDGPEGQCLLELERLRGALERLRERLAGLCVHAPLPAELERACAALNAAFERFARDLKRHHSEARDDPPAPV